MSSLPASLLPPDEAARLDSLRYYDILPAFHEPVFDEFVALAARVFSLPISLIALVDEEEVHYKANYGMPGNDVQPRSEALCATAILKDTAVVYQDLTVEKSPLITARAARAAQVNGLRFYAAAPLRMPDRRNIGSLCIIDRQPRVFSPDEQRLLERLAGVVSKTVAVRCACRSLPGGGEWEWDGLRQRLQGETQSLTALVRYLFARQGVQVPVLADSLAQVSRRLEDLHEVLDQFQG
ncbi:GAF domain-containing protein [Hymenobacter caeli]|uniref:GAF domain-containing protein n=1 Tax=Hymenobacter caeli TaxID=2735894 RepID=A0ABX2FMG0_9BACT|nr:GAF domain-containing protein [Hymenobacter caeli]NRT17694.1 hypothetical protein [Hymenobacter caeli]